MALSKVNPNLITQGATGRKNLVINGAMTVAQRVGTTSTVANNYGATPDRIRQEAYGDATASWQQVTDAPVGFKNSLKVTCAGTALPSAGNTLRLMTGLEGQDIAHLEYGTAQAKNATLSFYVKASETGIYSTALVNIAPSGNIVSNVNRSHIKTYTIDSANTWEYKTLTFSGCPDGTWGSSNSNGITIVFDLGSGSNHQGAKDSWLTTSDTFAAGQVSLGDSNGGSWQMTGLQFELGSVATDFEHRTYAESLLACQRYYEIIADGGRANDSPFFGIGHGVKSDQINWFYDFKAEKRATFTLIVNTVTNGYYGKNHSSEKNNNTLGMTSVHQSLHSIRGYLTGITGVTEQSAYSMQCNGAGCLIAVEAEL